MFEALCQYFSSAQADRVAALHVATLVFHFAAASKATVMASSHPLRGGRGRQAAQIRTAVCACLLVQYDVHKSMLLCV